MKQIGMRWPDELIERIDKARGEVSRSEFVRSIVERQIDPPSVVPNPFGEGSIIITADEDSVTQTWTSEPISFEDCRHAETFKDGEVTTCRACGGTRPYFSWQAPDA